MYDHDDELRQPAAPDTGDTQPTPFSPLTFNPNPYLRYFAGSDLSDDQKQILLEELWGIMVAFVDMGFGISPIQQAMDKSPEEKSSLASGFSDVVKSKNNRKINRKRKLRPATPPGVER